MKDLPRVFANRIDNFVNNDQEYYYSNSKNNREERQYNDIDIMKKVNDIFSSKNHVYKSKVKIKTRGGEVIKEIVGKNSREILTIEGEHLKISDILDIEKIY